MLSKAEKEKIFQYFISAVENNKEDHFFSDLKENKIIFSDIIKEIFKENDELYIQEKVDIYEAELEIKLDTKLKEVQKTQQKLSDYLKQSKNKQNMELFRKLSPNYEDSRGLAPHLSKAEAQNVVDDVIKDNIELMFKYKFSKYLNKMNSEKLKETNVIKDEAVALNKKSQPEGTTSEINRRKKALESFSQSSNKTSRESSEEQALKKQLEKSPSNKPAIQQNTQNMLSRDIQITIDSVCEGNSQIEGGDQERMAFNNKLKARLNNSKPIQAILKFVKDKENNDITFSDGDKAYLKHIVEQYLKLKSNRTPKAPTEEFKIRLQDCKNSKLYQPPSKLAEKFAEIANGRLNVKGGKLERAVRKQFSVTTKDVIQQLKAAYENDSPNASPTSSRSSRSSGTP